MSAATTNNLDVLRVPREIREAAGFKAGDRVRFEVIEPGRVLIIAEPNLTLEEFKETYGSDEPVDWQRAREQGLEDVAEAYLEEVARNMR